MLRSLAAAFLILAAIPAVAQTLTSGDGLPDVMNLDEAGNLLNGRDIHYGLAGGFADQCRGTDEPDYGRCMGTLTGILYMEDVASAFMRAPIFCVPSSIDIDLVRQAFVSWANRFPQHRGQPIPFAILAALRQTWPCQQSRLE